MGGDGTRRQPLHEAIAEGATVRSVLRQLSAHFPQLHEALWVRKSGDLAEPIEVPVNDAVLSMRHVPDSEVVKTRNGVDTIDHVPEWIVRLARGLQHAPEERRRRRVARAVAGGVRVVEMRERVQGLLELAAAREVAAPELDAPVSEKSDMSVGPRRARLMWGGFPASPAQHSGVPTASLRAADGAPHGAAMSLPCQPPAERVLSSGRGST